MTYWIVQADYRPLTDKSPRYAFLADDGRTKAYVKAEFLSRYPALKNVATKELTEEEMGKESLRKWIMWI